LNTPGKNNHALLTGQFPGKHSSCQFEQRRLARGVKPFAAKINIRYPDRAQLFYGYLQRITAKHGEIRYLPCCQAPSVLFINSLSTF